MKLIVNALQKLKWKKKIYVFISIRNVKITKVIHTDASLDGRGASHGSTARIEKQCIKMFRNSKNKALYQKKLGT